MYTIPSKIEDAAKKLTEEKYVIQIVPLKYIPVTEVSKMIKPFLSDGADIIEHPPQNILLIGDIASNIRKVRRSHRPFRYRYLYGSEGQDLSDLQFGRQRYCEGDGADLCLF